MEFFDVIKNRRSVRLYKKYKIPKKHILKILEAGRLSPSGANRQPYRFIVIDDAKIIDLIASVNELHSWIKNTSIVIAAVCLPEMAGENYIGKKRKWHEIDTAIAMTHMCLAATALGYGSCWVAWYDIPELKNFLRIPDNEILLALLVIGKSFGNTDKIEKKSFDELFFYNFYTNRFKIK